VYEFQFIGWRQFHFVSGDTQMEVAMLVGLAALGYSLATQPAVANAESTPKISPMETFVNPQKGESATDKVTVLQTPTGHGNMVPFFGANQTQSMYSGATEGVLDLYTGKGKTTFFHKEEAPAFFKPEAGNGRPWKTPVETEWEQERQVTSLATKNTFPINQIQVGPGVNDGYTNIPSGGYQQDAAREYAMPKTTDELRVIGQEKVTYTSQPTPGAHYITEMGLQAPVKKNKPDRFAVLTGADGSLDHVNTTQGQQVASSLYPEQMMKLQNRESMGMLNANPATTAAAGGISYIRAFTEPFQEFMKLTVEGRAPPAGPVGGASVQAGPQSYNVQTHRDESLHNNTRGFEAPLMTFGGQAPSAAQQGSQRYVVPLQQDVYARDVGTPGLLDAFKKNPYTKSFDSVA
jgi:hypothetical protein